MLLTEEEAKTKRCQESFGDRVMGDGGIAMVKPSVDPLSTGNEEIEVAHFTSPSFCIGSACMAWRWNMISHSNPERYR